MIFIDSNVPMYLVGGPHPHAKRTRDLFDEFLRRNDRIVTSAEVFQEILHRYSSLRRPQAIRDAWQLLERAVDETFSIEYADVATAREVLESVDGISARDALSVAVMRRHGVTRIFSFDTGFDKVEGIVRLA